MALSLLVSHVSWVLVESRALRFARRFRPGGGAQAPAVPVPAEDDGEAQTALAGSGRRAA
jgi:hypothetical protein